MKTMKQWQDSGQDLSRFLKIGDTIDDELFDYFIGVVFPECMTSTCVQIGEPMNHDEQGQPTFMTIEFFNSEWTYTGIKTSQKGAENES